MGLFDRFRGGEKSGDAEVKTSKTQAELKEMMEVQSRLKGLADKLPEGFDEVIEIPAGVDRPANSDGKVRVSKKTHPVTSVVEGSSRTEERTKTRIAFSTLRHEEVDSGLQSVSSAVVYTVDKNGLYGPVNNNPITEVDSHTTKDMIAVLDTVSKEKLPE